MATSTREGYRQVWIPEEVYAELVDALANANDKADQPVGRRVGCELVVRVKHPLRPGGDPDITFECMGGCQRGGTCLKKVNGPRGEVWVYCRCSGGNEGPIDPRIRPNL